MSTIHITNNNMTTLWLVLVFFYYFYVTFKVTCRSFSKLTVDNLNWSENYQHLKDSSQVFPGIAITVCGKAVPYGDWATDPRKKGRIKAGMDSPKQYEYLFYAWIRNGYDSVVKCVGSEEEELVGGQWRLWLHLLNLRMKRAWDGGGALYADIWYSWMHLILTFPFVL